MKILVTSFMGKAHSLRGDASYDCGSPTLTSIDRHFVLSLFDTVNKTVDLLFLCGWEGGVCHCGDYGCSEGYEYRLSAHHIRRDMDGIDIEKLRNPDEAKKILKDILRTTSLPDKPNVPRDIQLMFRGLLEKILGDKSFIGTDVITYDCDYEECEEYAMEKCVEECECPGELDDEECYEYCRNECKNGKYKDLYESEVKGCIHCSCGPDYVPVYLNLKLYDCHFTNKVCTEWLAGPVETEEESNPIKCPLNVEPQIIGIHVFDDDYNLVERVYEEIGYEDEDDDEYDDEYGDECADFFEGW